MIHTNDSNKPCEECSKIFGKHQKGGLKKWNKQNLKKNG